ncbi:transcription termination factor Rho [Akkermansiaceae bacterium]|nr:transcription termination factor Rho [Akkermansiaceae bacterium]
MNDTQEPELPAHESPEVEIPSPKKKAVKKAAKKAVKKTAKKAAKKTTRKKVAKRAAKKTSLKTPTDEVVLEEADVEEVTSPVAPSPVAPAKAVLVLETETITPLIEPGPSSSEEPADKAETETGEVERRAPREARKPRLKKELPPPPPPPEVPEAVTLSDFRQQALVDLHAEIERLPVRIPTQATKAQLVYTILSCYATHGTKIEGEGVLEFANDNFGMLRDPLRSFRNSPDDIYIPMAMIRDFNLREGQLLKASIRPPQGRDKYLSVDEILEIEGCATADYKAPAPFDFLTSLFPEERFVLEQEDDAGFAVRVVDLVAPLGKGQRGLIVAPPRGGKTILLKQIAKSLQTNHPEAELVVLLLDERPEEVTDFEDMVGSNVYASTFDESSKRHAQVASIVLERSRRLVEQGKDVVILLDSLTRLARGYNNSMRGGPIGSGGISPKAITETRKFFGAARNVEGGGSLTILATCLIETENRMDDVIFEELKGTGNMEVRLDQLLAEQRIYPAIHIPQSGTRNDDRLYHPDELQRVLDIRRHLAALPIGEAIETLLGGLAKTKTNTELLLKGLR